MGKQFWTGAELAQEFNLSLRTINGYVYRGLLPPPEGKGRAARYTYRHYHRLNDIRKVMERNRTLSSLAESFREMEEAK